MNDDHLDMAQWFEAHSRPLVLYARQWLDDHASADVVQESFMRLLSQKRRPDDVRAWLFRTVRNAALNELRRRQTSMRHAHEIAACRPGWFQEHPGSAMDAQAAQQALQQLPPSQSELIVMRIWGHLTYEQMAQITGQAVSTVHEHYVAAIESLQRKMVTPWESKAK